MGVIICGLNGTGKRMLGKALATDPDHIASPRTREDVAERLLDEVRTYENFILASVKGDHGEELYSFFDYAILRDIPRDIRRQRVRERSFRQVR